MAALAATAGNGLDSLTAEVARQAHARHPDHRTIAWRFHDEDRSIFARHKKLIQGLVVVGSAACVERLEALRFQPLKGGRDVPGSFVALALSGSATCIARKYRRSHGDVEDLFAAITAGLASGILVKMIAKRAGGC